MIFFFQEERMMRRLKMLGKLVIVSSVFLIMNTYAATSTSTPVGYWKTIDDITGKPKSIIKISESQNHTLQGQIVKLFAAPSKIKQLVCVSCNGDKHNQPILGMVILSNLKSMDKNWDKGNILDPQNGKTYNCSAKLADNGKKLDVRGYIGMPLLGRSQTWERVDLMSEQG